MTDKDGAFERAWVSDDVPALLREALGASGTEVLPLPQDDAFDAPGNRELVILTDLDAVSPFILCARLKDPGPRRVFVAMLLMSEEAERAAPIARFCMADAVLSIGDVHDEPERVISELRRLVHRPGPSDSIDVLLARLEQRMAGDARELAERVTQGLSADRERSFVESATDPETGLFDGPFMAFKLEEEFKRSWRFRTPLAVLLFDLPSTAELGGPDRGRVLGEVAGVFLNECRDIDVLGRYDDTSFLMLLPHTGPVGARVLAKRVLDRLRAVDAPIELEAAVAIVAVPLAGVERKDELLDLARLTLVSAWAGSGEERVQVAT